MKIQSFPKFRDASYLQPQRVRIVIPAFTLSVSIWANASTILAQFPFGNDDYYFSIKIPVIKFGENFVAAVRWKVNDTCYRFKLWDATNAVLYYSVYAGERIGLNAILEIWSVNSASVPELSEAYTLYSSQIVFPDANTTSCSSCAQPDAAIDLVQQAASVLPPYAFCNPFCNSLCEP